MSRDFQVGLNGVVSAFAQGIADECKGEPGVDQAEVDCGLSAALINAAAEIMLRRGSSIDDVLSLVADHVAALKLGVH